MSAPTECVRGYLRRSLAPGPRLNAPARALLKDFDAALREAFQEGRAEAEASAATMREALEKARKSGEWDVAVAANLALATDAGAAMLERVRRADGEVARATYLESLRKQEKVRAEQAEAERDALRAELANRDATLAALRDAVERLERTIAPPPGPQLLDDTLAAVHAA